MSGSNSQAGIAGVLCIGRRAVGEEIEAEAAPLVLERVEEAVSRAAGQRIGLSCEGLGQRREILPMPGNLGHAGDRAVTEIVLAIGEGVAVAVNGDAVGLAVPGADRSLEIVDESSISICCLTQSGISSRRPLPAVSPSKGAPIWMMSKSTVLVAIFWSRRRVVIGLGEIDPADLGAGIGLPRLEEAAKQEVVQVLVVETHEGQFDAGELAFCYVGLGCAEAELADLLPIGIGGRSLADAGDLQDFSAQIVLRGRLPRQRAERAGGSRSQGRHAGRPLQKVAAGRPGANEVFEDAYFHVVVPPRAWFRQFSVLTPGIHPRPHSTRRAGQSMQITCRFPPAARNIKTIENA